MINIQEQISLQPFNTFGIDVTAKYFTVVESKAALLELLQLPVFQSEKHILLGAGSNVLFTQDFDGLVIKNEIKGISVVEENETMVVVEVGAGEIWHDFVLYAIDKNWGGIENLSLIPGTMGAAPMQNIGAYGVEIKEVIKKVSAVEIASGEEKIFTNEDCQFGYRESIFKHEHKNKFIISSVTLRLTKTNHTINVSYGGLLDSPHIKDKETITIQDVSAAVIEIRRSKLPDPVQIGNAGSFFKNPVIETESYNSLQKNYPTIPGFKVNDIETKVPAAWLIEQTGWKGKTIGNVGVHKNQPLVLVNFGGGRGDEILSLAKQVQHSVTEKFGVKLQLEVNVV